MSRILPAYMTQAEYARHRGLSRQRVHQFVVGGRIPRAENGLIPVRAADLALSRPLRNGRPPKVAQESS